MTEKEKIIVSAYTGFLMCDFHKVHKYIEDKLGRPVYTHEMAFDSVQKEIREKTKSDFLGLCYDKETEKETGQFEPLPMKEIRLP